MRTLIRNQGAICHLFIVAYRPVLSAITQIHTDFHPNNIKYVGSKLFVKIGKFAVYCIFYWLIYDWKYDRAQGIHGSSR